MKTKVIKQEKKFIIDKCLDELIGKTKISGGASTHSLVHVCRRQR